MFLVGTREKWSTTHTTVGSAQVDIRFSKYNNESHGKEDVGVYQVATSRHCISVVVGTCSASLWTIPHFGGFASSLYQVVSWSFPDR